MRCGPPNENFGWAMALAHLAQCPPCSAPMLDGAGQHPQLDFPAPSTGTRQRGGGENTPSAVLAKKSSSKLSNKTVTFCDIDAIVTDPFGFPMQLGVSLYLLPVLRGRSGTNVHETDFATTSNERL